MTSSLGCARVSRYLSAPPPRTFNTVSQVQGVIAEYERAKIAERYRRGKLWRARAGECAAWEMPLKRSGDKSSIVPARSFPAPGLFEVIDRLFRWAARPRRSRFGLRTALTPG